MTLPTDDELDAAPEASSELVPEGRSKAVAEREPEAALAKVPMTPEKPLRRRPRLRTWLWAGTGLALVGLLGTAFVGGWIVGSRAATGTGSALEPSFIDVPVLGPDAQSAIMPDIRGLDKDTALQVIADSGISVAGVTVSVHPYAGQAGVVVEQTPAFGVAHPGTVALVVSAPAVVPDAVGRTVSDVVGDLAALGAGITRVGKYDPKRAVGTVLGVSPATGSDLPVSVELTIAVAPATTLLSRVSTSTGGCKSDNVSLKGTVYSNSLSCDASTKAATTSWLLAAAVDRISGVIGIPDDRDTADTATVQVLLDGTVVANYDLKWGQSETIDLTTSGALKLTMIITTTAAKTSVGLGDVLLFGDPQALSKLKTQ